MHYKESKQILQSIKSAKKILIVGHADPDGDSIGSTLGLFSALKKINKNSEIVCKDEVPEYLQFLPNSKNIKVVDFGKFIFEDYDLFISS